MTRYEAYVKARTEYLKKKEREANDYHRDACRATASSAAQHRRQSQRAD